MLQKSEGAMDDALAASFPASDPPSWNPGLARPGSAVPVHGRVARGSWRALLRVFAALAGAAGVALAVPVVILLVGLPIVISVRGVLELFRWLVPGLR